MSNGLNLIQIAKELLMIYGDMPFRFHNPETNIDNFIMKTFTQVWGSTATGFGGIGGQAMTEARTYVFIPASSIDASENCLVYFGGTFAYEAPYSKVFINDVVGESMKSRDDIARYLKGVE